MKLFHLAFVLSVFVSSKVYSQAVLGRFNIHIGQPKVERNQASKEAIAAEREEKDRNTQARLLDSILENGNYKEHDHFINETQTLYTNEFWKMRILNQNKDARLDRIEYKINQSSVQIYKEPIYLPKLGMNSVEYRSVDKLGNFEDWKIQRIFKDTTAPSLNWDIKGRYERIDDHFFVREDSLITVQGFDPQSGVMGIFYKFQGGTWKSLELDKQKLTGNIALESPESKDTTQTILEITSLDRVMNRSEKLQIPITIISKISLPNIRLSQVNEFDGINYCNKNSSFYFHNADSKLKERVYYKHLPNGDWTEYVSGNIFLTPKIESDKEIRLLYKNSNSIGLESEERTFECKLDSTSPKSEIRKLPRD